MMNGSIINLLYRAADVLCVLFFYSFCIEMPIKKNRFILIFSSSFLIISEILSFIFPDKYGETIFFVGFLSAYFLLYKESTGQKIIYYFEATAIFTTLRGISETLYNSFNSLAGGSLSRISRFSVYYVTVVSFLAFIRLYILKERSIRLNLLNTWQHIQLVCWAFLDAIIIIILSRMLTPFDSVYSYIIIILADALFYIQMLIIFNFYISKAELTIQVAQNDYMIQRLTDHYTYLKENDEKTAQFRHDYTNHLLQIRNLASLNKYNQLIDYIDEIVANSQNLTSGDNVNNDIANSIIRQYRSMYEKIGAKFTVLGAFPSSCIISPYDMCTILSNLLQNAYEAVIESDKKEVQLSIAVRPNQILLDLSNSSLTAPVIVNDTYISSKSDRKNHGYGIKNVTTCVRKYNGVMDCRYSYDVKKFSVSIIIMNSSTF